jgi:dynein heavy chain
VDSWLAGRPEREAAALRPCFDRLVPALLEYVRVACKPVVHTEAVCQVSTLLTLLTGVLGPSTKAGGGIGGEAGGGGSAARGEEGGTPSAATSASTAASRRASVSLGAGGAGAAEAGQLFERHFLYCVAWSLGGLLTPGDRVKFDAHLRSLTGEAPASQGEGDTIFEFLVDEQSGRWQPWRERVPEWAFPAAGPGGRPPRFTQMIVPTLDSVRYERLLALVHSVGKASLVRKHANAFKLLRKHANAFKLLLRPEDLGVLFLSWPPASPGDLSTCL